MQSNKKLNECGCGMVAFAQINPAQASLMTK